MPTIIVDLEALKNELPSPEKDRDYIEWFDQLCFQYGLEYDGIDANTAPTAVKVEVPANRYDILCREGLVAALGTFLDPTAEFPTYTAEFAATAHDLHTITVDGSVERIRPYCLGAIFYQVKMDEISLASFIDLQDKLHQNIGRRRTLVAIGTHDLDNLSPPFTYRALPRKESFKFTPLNQTQECDGEAMFSLLSESSVGKYLPLIANDLGLIPCIQDSQNRVASIPPIINSARCKITTATRNVFVELTGSDQRKLEIALDVIAAFMGRKTAKPYTVQPMKIIYTGSHMGTTLYRHNQPLSVTREIITPSLSTDHFYVSAEYVRTLIGKEKITTEQMVTFAKKMMLNAKVESEDLISVECPISRRDILHPCDIAEDIAVAYGYENIQVSEHESVSLESIQNISERVRRWISQCGWRECLTFALISTDDYFTNLRRTNQVDLKSQFSFQTRIGGAFVADSKTKEFELIRPSLIPGLLKSLATNQHAELPIRLFEIGDCVRRSETSDNRIEHKRHVAALISDNDQSGLEYVHGLLDFVFNKLKLSPVYEQDSKFKYKLADLQVKYKLAEIEDGAFLSKRSVEIQVLDKTNDVVDIIGRMGVVHPMVLKNYGIPIPCSLFEFVLDPFLNWLWEFELAAP